MSLSIEDAQNGNKMTCCALSRLNRHTKPVYSPAACHLWQTCPGTWACLCICCIHASPHLYYIGGAGIPCGSCKQTHTWESTAWSPAKYDDRTQCILHTRWCLSHNYMCWLEESWYPRTRQHWCCCVQCVNVPIMEAVLKPYSHIFWNTCVLHADLCCTMT